ncbi:sensor histidine kinase [Deinococcus yavapaiensis]|uniref:histidine kinase n=1 Tax=Deinococcus yavapaiensis KR-236 TaxID=694435 RepID=A0A318S8U3_9DEIO|nr:histidine kinase [Deinococcus yavapaiensis]PYE55456.1 signal transduction histidine kinase [Deinococcus yavapaiensis KR-236]
MQWFHRLSPASKIVVLFASLNVALVLLFTLTVAPFSNPGARLPLLDPLQASVRVGLAVLVVLAVLRVVDLVRPSWRSVGVSASVLTVATALLTFHYTPILALAYLPLVLRVRWTLPKTILACALGLTVLLPVSFRARGMDWWGIGRRDVLDVLTLTLAVGALGAYLLLTFELALREARARQEITASHREVSRLRDLAVDRASRDERARMARELHDTLGHHLTAQWFDLQLLKEDPRLGEALDRALQRNADAIADLRRAVHALRESSADENVTRALSRLVAVWAPAANVELALDDVSDALDEEGRVTVYRAAQEALTNALKHAPSERVTLTLKRDGNAVRFEARNARGAPPSREGQGVRGLRERANSLGGDAGLAYHDGQVRLWMILPTPSNKTS